MKNILLISAFVLFAGLIGYFLYNRKGGFGGNTVEGIGGNGWCVVRPAYAKPYSTEKENDGYWGQCHLGLKQHFFNGDKAKADEYVGHCWGFFKAANIEPTISLVKALKPEIQRWFDNGGGNHWEVQVGGLECKGVAS